jgi:vitamin B12 transporter
MLSYPQSARACASLTLLLCALDGPSARAQAPAPLDSPASEPVEAAPVDVTVRALSKAQQARESARAVEVIELERERRSTADLGQVLSRHEGIQVRRSGGLGSDARLTLNGLSDEQVRVFLDGLPVELAGYPFGINNVPVEVVQRVEVHRGVVPMRLGADALGGAIELISDTAVRGTHGTVSYQGGSFDTHRMLASGRHYDARTGLFVRAEGFFDASRNDYPIEVTLQDARGASRRRVRRNNDAYRGAFGGLELGVVQRPWARRLTLRGFLGDVDKEIPSDPLMQNAYGEVTSSRRVSGAIVRFESVPFSQVTLSATAGYSLRQSTFRDLSSCAYDFVGRCIAELSPARGERSPSGADQHVLQHSVFGRLQLERPLGQGHALRLAVSPTFTRRAGEDRAIPAADDDPLEGERELLTVVSGLEYQVDLFADRLQNIAFVKHYAMHTRSQAALPAGGFLPIDDTHQRAGAGDGLRYRISDPLQAKLSYEWATRLPSPDQLFGDAALVDANLRLKPESAHNVNLSSELRVSPARVGELRAQLTVFGRFIDDLIMAFPSVSSLRFTNVQRARSVGVEGSVGWTSPGQWLQVDANATFQDYRNRSHRGTYGEYDGQRIPSRPFVFSNAVAQLFARGLLQAPDELSLIWRSSYVKDFFVGWADLARDGTRLTVPAQRVHSVGLNLLLQRGKTTVSSSLEVHNLTDARVFDFYGVQLPGRSVAAKLTLGV